MSLSSIARRMRLASRRVTSVIASTAVAATLMVVGTGTASAADNRSFLRPDSTGTCAWAAGGYWLQDCDVFSPSMGTNIRVQIQPSKNGGHAGLYLLDGAEAPTPGDWSARLNAQQVFANNNINLVIPNGGKNSFYADWVGNPQFGLLTSNPLKYKWETFLTQELPPYLQQHFGINPSTNSIMGFSMGGTAALSLTERHGNQFQQVVALSPTPLQTLPGMNTFWTVAWAARGGYNFNNMYGALINPRRFAEDPTLNVAKLRGKNVYVSAGSGVPTANEFAVLGAPVVAQGATIELACNIGTRAFHAVATGLGVPLKADYPSHGVHSFPLWSSQLQKAKPVVLNYRNAW